MPGNHSEKLEILQGMRAVAATGVLLWHAIIFLGPDGQALGTALFHAPSVIGVDLFFLICGFVIVLSSMKTAAGVTTVLSPGVFLIKRMARICPLYMLCTLAIFVIERGSERQTGELLLRSLAFLPIPNAEYPNIFSPTMTVGWSITYEVYFYGLFSAALFLGGKFWRLLATWAAAALLLPALLMPELLASITQKSAMLAILTSPLNLLFLVGMAIGMLYRSPGARFPSRRAAVIAVMVAPLPILYQYATHTAIAHGLSGVGASLVFLLTIVVIADKTLSLRCGRLLNYLGDISYSIYLTHPIVMWGVMWANERYAWGSPLQGWFCIGVTLLATIAASALTHRYVEMGLSVWIRNWALANFTSRPGKSVFATLWKAS